MSIEKIIDSAIAVAKTRDNRIIQVDQAVKAVSDQVAKQFTEDSDTQTVDSALQAFQSAAVNFKLGDDIGPLKDLAASLFAAEGQRLVDLDSLNQSIATAIKEQAEADAANVDEDAAIADLKQLANDYTKELPGGDAENAKVGHTA